MSDLVKRMERDRDEGADLTPMERAALARIKELEAEVERLRKLVFQYEKDQTF